MPTRRSLIGTREKEAMMSDVKMEKAVKSLFARYWGAGWSEQTQVVTFFSCLLLYLLDIEEEQWEQSDTEARSSWMIDGINDHYRIRDLVWTAYKHLLERYDVRTEYAHNESFLSSEIMVDTFLLIKCILETFEIKSSRFYRNLGELYDYILGNLDARRKKTHPRIPGEIARFLYDAVGLKEDEMFVDPFCNMGEVLLYAYRDRKGGSRTSNHLVEEPYNIEGLVDDNTSELLSFYNLRFHGIHIPRIVKFRPNVDDALCRADVVATCLPIGRKSTEIQSHKSYMYLQEYGSLRMEYLYLEEINNCIKPGGRACVLLPRFVLCQANRVGGYARWKLLEQCRIDFVVNLPGAVFRPHIRTETAILHFTKTDKIDLDRHFVRFYSIKGRKELAPGDLCKVLSGLRRDVGKDRAGSSFSVSMKEIAQNDYILDSARYSEFHPTHFKEPLSIVNNLLTEEIGGEPSSEELRKITANGIVGCLLHLRKLLSGDDND